MTDLRVSNTYRSAALEQTLRVIVVTPSPSGTYSFVADQNMVFTSVRVDAVAGIGDRWAIMHVAGVEKMNAKMEPGQTTLTVGTVLVSNGDAVEVRLRGVSGDMGLTITAAGTIPTQYRLSASTAAPTRWRREAGEWVPVYDSYRRVGTANRRARAFRKVDGTLVRISD